MRPPERLEKCICGIGLGIEELSKQDIFNSQEFERRYNIINKSILFLGPSNSSQRCTINDKLNELKRIIGEYYVDTESKVIAIPEQTTLHERDKPQVFVDENAEIYKRFVDRHLENVLHNSIIKALREIQAEAFVFQGFLSDSCLKEKLLKGKKFRKNDPNPHPMLNIHEKEIMEMLCIDPLTEKDLNICVEQHRDKVGKKLVKKECWLISKE